MNRCMYTTFISKLPQKKAQKIFCLCTWKDFLASCLSTVRLMYSSANFNSLEDTDEFELVPLGKLGLWASSYIAELEGGNGGGGGAFFFFGRSWTG